MKTYIKINQKTYDALAEEYGQKMQEYIISDVKIVAPFIKHLKTKFKKINILELGPGSGLNLSYFEKEGLNTTAIEISSKMIEVSKKTSQKTKYIHGDFFEYDFGRSKFEGIFAKAFIHLFSRKDASIVLKKIFKLLKNEGVAFIGTTIHEKSEEGFFEKKDYNKKLRRYRKKWLENELSDEIKKAGFSIYKKTYNNEPAKDKKWVGFILVKTHHAHKNKQ